MKFVSAQVILITFLFNFSYSQAQCVDTNNIYTFVYNNTTYELVSELKTWTDAAACAVARGGVLAEINDAGEQNAIFNEILTNGGITYGTSVPTIPMGNGNGSFVWLGGNDMTTEGAWMWDGGNTGSLNQFWSGDGSGMPVNSAYENWGNSSNPTYNQPNDRQGEDAVALSINGWANGFAGYWRDIDEANALYYLIEFNSNDSIPPVPDSSFLRPISGTCYILNPPIPTATDSVAGQVNGVSNLTFPLVGAGTYLVTWTYTDFAGNSSSQTQVFTIIDTIAPVPDLQTLADVYADCSVDSLISPTASDVCSGSIIGTTNTPLPITSSGSTIVTWSFDDGNGNISTYDQLVTILDTIPPVVDQPVQNIVSNCPIYSINPPTATDNCSGSIVGTTTTIFPIINSDTTLVAWEFMDSLGNILIVEHIVYINPFFSQIERNGSVISAIESGLSYQWLDCNDNYSEIPNETNQSLIIPSNGAYCVVVSDGICSDTSECIEIGDLGMATNNTELNLELYPNPTTNLLTIQHLDASMLYDIVLADMSGKVLQSFAISNASTYELSINFERGMYLLIVTSASNQSTYKILKK